jgi:[ribosomal protein S5]-alanine N-acetyltransferase
MPTPQFPTLETPRLRLRELRHADVAAVLAIHADARHMQHWGNTLFVDPVGAHDFIAQCRAGWKLQVPVMRWAIERLSDGAVLGTCGLFNWDQRWQKCTVGYELNVRDARQGFMREALRAVLAYGFSRGQLHHVEALIHPDNTASLGLAAQLGFQVEGRLREVAFWDDKRHDMIQLGLLQPELVI